MRKLKAKEIRYVLYFMIIVFVVSSFSFVNLSVSEKDEVSAFLLISGVGQEHFSEYSVPLGANLYYFLYSTGFISFQSDYSVKCVGQICNDYLSGNYWQVFLNNDYVSMNYFIGGGEEFFLHYGPRISLINVSLELMIGGYNEIVDLRVVESFSLRDFLLSYNASFLNDSLNCVFGECGNWSVLVNNESALFDYSLKEYDAVLLQIE
ncbi:MAG: hypothetical protein PHS81_01765 [Candidatus Nanoarchaeia archaeon]|nr:hypothetical protein [Candidatus Nanoarchaeia archaeon]